jgi:hypothetical protein
VAKKAKAEAVSLWVPVVGFSRTARVAGKQLALVTQQLETGLWSVVAIESSKHNLSAVLAEHAHKLVIERVSIAEAFSAGDAFLTAWFADRGVGTAEACRCVEIGLDPVSTAIDALDQFAARMPSPLQHLTNPKDAHGPEDSED